MLKDQKNLLENHKIRHNFNYKKIKSIEAIDEEFKIALPIYKSANSGSVPKFGNVIQPFPNENLLTVNTTSNAALPIIHRAQPNGGNPFFRGKNAQKKVLAVRNSSNDSMESQKPPLMKPLNRARSNILKPLQLENENGKHYFNKQVMYKCNINHLMFE